MTLDADLHNLVIIGRISTGNKLYHSDGLLYIDNVTPWNGVSRFLRREGRDRTIVSVKRALQSVEERIEDLTSSAEPLCHGCPRARRLTMILDALGELPNGIDNLKFTYVSDASVQAALDLIRRAGLCLTQRLAAVLEDAARAKEGAE